MSATTEFDVLVVGAGPAGATTATYLARAGRRVAVVDKATFPRDKCCGDGLTTLALRELNDLGLDPRAVPSWFTVKDVCLRSPSGHEVHLAMPTDGMFAATTPRRELDAALVTLAASAGADLRQGVSVESLSVDATGVDVATSAGTLRAAHVVAADGMWSPTRRFAGVSDDGYRGEWSAFRQYVTGVTGPAAERLYVWFDADLLPGYAWSFPLPGGRANVGFGVMRDQDRRGRDAGRLWAGLLARQHIAATLGPHATPEDRHLAWPIPAGIDRAVLTAGRVLFAGDAARATDVMTGEGIGQALVTGRLAAEAILATPGADPVAVAQRYRHAVRKELLADHRVSKVLNRLLANPLLARGAVRIVGTSEFTRRNFVRWMFEDEPRAIAFTPRRWHRDFLRRPGIDQP